MKYFGIVVVILAALFINQIVAKPSSALSSLEKNVNDTTESLKSYKNGLAVNGDKKFSAYLEKSKAGASDNANRTLQRIEARLEEAANGGSDVADCGRSAHVYIDDALEKILPVLDNCVNDNKPDWQPLQNRTENLVKAGEVLLERINEIKVECSNSSSQEVCIALKLPEVAGLVGYYKLEVGGLKKDVALTTADGFRRIGICSGLPLITFRVELRNAEHNALECINAANQSTERTLDF